MFQVFNGDLSEKSLVDPQSIVDTLALFHEKGKLHGVLCGWSKDREFYQTLGKTLKSWDVPMYFKTAVFSEWNEIQDFDPMIDMDRQNMKPYVLNESEKFLFRCPSSERNRQKILDLFDSHMRDLGFQGVFLDRIRYSSLQGGLESVGGCFCDVCTERYKTMGLNVSSLKEKLRKHRNEKKMSLGDYTDGKWQIEDPELNAFFRARCRILQDSVHFFVQEFHKRGMKVGLDLFTPALGYFAGQDVIALSEEADFIKPMLYRYTDAPAGIPFEVRAMEAAIGKEAEKKLETQCGKGEDHWGSFVVKELKVLKDSRCPVYPGMEVNTVEPIVTMTPQRVKDNLKLLNDLNYEIMVPSWNLAKMTPECLQVLLQE